MPDLHLIRPWWLLAIPVGLVLVRLAWRRGGHAAGWARACDPALLPHLIVAAGAGRMRWAAHLTSLGVVVAATALAGPSWSRLEQPVYRDLGAVVVVLDLSRSMDAGDLQPSRLARARFKIADLLERERGKQTGLVVYAGDAFVVAPLTEDVATLTNLLPSLSSDLMPVRGSRPDLGLAAAGRLLDGAGAGHGDVILFSDGADDPRASAAAARLRAAGARVSAIAVGSAGGAPVPLPDGGFLKDADGNIVVPGLDARGLAAIARAGGGLLTPMTTDDADLDLVLGAGERAFGGARAVDRTTEAWLDRGPWLVLALLPLGALAFRRGWLASALACALLAPLEPTQAFDWESLWARPDQQAARALRDGAPARARAAAPDATWRAPARYRQGEYDAAARDYAQLAGPRADYNRGNALARAGRLEEALIAYDAALEAHPDMADARHNRELVERLLRSSPPPGGAADGRPQPGERRDGAAPSERLMQPEDGAQSDAGSDQSPGSHSRKPGDVGGDERQADAEPQADQADDGPEPRAARQADDDAPGPSARAGEVDAERRQATEQWLRRIPDDPGGLLRRKFALQHRRRGTADEGAGSW